MKSTTACLTSVFFICFIFDVSGATMCKPLSRFKIDCNFCTCSATGREYSCTEKFCPPVPSSEEFIKEDSKDGYVLLKPKQQHDKYDDEDLVLTRNLRRHPRMKFINDEISLSREDDSDNGLEKTKFETFEDVSSENDVENWDDINYDLIRDNL